MIGYRTNLFEGIDKFQLCSNRNVKIFASVYERQESPQPRLGVLWRSHVGSVLELLHCRLDLHLRDRIRVIQVAGDYHLYSIGKLSVVLVFKVKELDRVRIWFGQLSPLESLLNLRQAIASTSEVGRENQNNHRFHPTLVDKLGDVVAEEDHQHMFLVIQRIVGIVAVDSSRNEFSIDPRPIF